MKAANSNNSNSSSNWRFISSHLLDANAVFSNLVADCSFPMFQLPHVADAFIISLMKFANILRLKLHLLNPLLAR
jgi:hypothetical protein